MMRLKNILLGSIVSLAIFNTQVEVDAAPIHDAAMHGELEKLQQELDNGVDVNVTRGEGWNPGWTALVVAIHYGKKEIAEKLLEAGANVNATDPNVDTALIQAIVHSSWCGMQHFAKKVLEAGASVNAVGEKGRTALMMAARYSDKYMVERLLKAGADVHARDQDGNTVLMWGAVGSDPEVVYLLLNAGADVSIANNKGNTPLMRAKYVVERVSANNRKSPLMEAQQRRTQEVVNLIEAWTSEHAPVKAMDQKWGNSSKTKNSN